MVFFFIAYLIIIILFCFPFKTKFVVFYSNTYKKIYFSATIGFINILPQKVKEKNNKKRRKRGKIKIGFKGFNLKKPIDFSLTAYASQPKSFDAAMKAFFGVSVSSVAKLINAAIPNADVLVVNNDDNHFYLQSKIEIKFNLFIIISSLLQTIKIGRR